MEWIGLVTYGLGAAAALLGVFKMGKLVGIVRQGLALWRKYESAVKADSNGGKKITEAEWAAIGRESIKLVKKVAEWWFARKR